jgi:hypothetical protein
LLLANDTLAPPSTASAIAATSQGGQQSGHASPWLEDVHEELSRVLGLDATDLCRDLGKKEWEAHLATAVDAACSGHWLGNIRAKLAKPATAGASLTPAEYVGKAVHKAAEDFGAHSDDTVYSGVAVSYNADVRKWKV